MSSVKSKAWSEGFSLALDGGDAKSAVNPYHLTRYREQWEAGFNDGFEAGSTEVEKQQAKAMEWDTLSLEEKVERLYEKVFG